MINFYKIIKPNDKDGLWEKDIISWLMNCKRIQNPTKQVINEWVEKLNEFGPTYASDRASFHELTDWVYDKQEGQSYATKDDDGLPD
jgi:hypothetical protein